MTACAKEQFWSPFAKERNGSQLDEFREKFQRSMRSCVRRGFTVEESFGMIWVETWEEIALTEEEQSLLYDELIRWAKTAFRRSNTSDTPIIHRNYSQVRVSF